jgi:predicted nucleic acid-binding protein
MILADTSVVIDFLRSADASMRRIIVDAPAAVCGVTRAEVLHGARSPAERVGVLEGLSLFRQLPIPNSAWDDVGGASRGLRLVRFRLRATDSRLTVAAPRKPRTGRQTQPPHRRLSPCQGSFTTSIPDSRGSRPWLTSFAPLGAGSALCPRAGGWPWSATHPSASPDLHPDVGDLLAGLRASGVAVPLADAVVASLAIGHGIELWTRDAQFLAVQRVAPNLRLFPG